MAATRAQRLLRRPERVIAVLRADDQQVHQVDAESRQRRGVRHLRWGDPDGALSCGRECSQRGKDQSQLTNAASIVQDLGKRLARPATPGELGFEGSKTA